ncbi:carbohydrate ABC transporter permease [Salinarimonas soli]|uniref:Carbohydrate ABC transporter permease n=1 Tax=Salinarimonas soli TaxID=1638099 RepID=A0A5B2VDC7_9HYPH|nr:carbohydrate ABC transporter permease [Salinarimonas soli]KAA2236775.1 carbohydrate ABC transporter permease [Salinarimonas soli]
MRARRARFSAGEALVWAALGLAGLVFLLPLYVVIVTALKPLAAIVDGSMLAPPRDWTIAPLAKAWSGACIGASCEGLRGGFLTSLRITLPAVAGSVAIGLVSGYALTQWRLPGARLAFALVIVANVLPYQAVLLPVALTLRRLGLFGTVEGLVLVHIAYGMPYTVLLFRNFFIGVPPEIVAAARVDGAGFWGILIHVLLPLSWPILAVAVALQFTAIWNDYLFSLVFGGPNPPVTVRLNNLINDGVGTKEYNVNMAGVLLVAAPALLVYWLAGRWFVRGLTLGGAR